MKHTIKIGDKLYCHNENVYPFNKFTKGKTYFVAKFESEYDENFEGQHFSIYDDNKELFFTNNCNNNNKAHYINWFYTEKELKKETRKIKLNTISQSGSIKESYDLNSKI